MTTPYFVGLVKQWVEGSANVQRAPTMGGGWERWAQGEICLALMGHLAFARCEVNAYTNTDRPDILTRTTTSGQNHWDIVELKCCKRWQNADDTWDHEQLSEFFSIRRVGKDISKAKLNDVKTAFKTNSFTKSAIGLFTLDDCKKYWGDDKLTMDTAKDKLIHTSRSIRYPDSSKTDPQYADVTFLPCTGPANVFIVYYTQ